MDAYGGKALRDSFSQAGYIAARVAVNAMLSIKNPDDINRNTVTAAIQNMKPYDTDILCMPWYWGGPEATEHNPNHVTRTVTLHDGKMEESGRLRRRCRSGSRQHRGFGKEAGNKDQRSGSSELARSQQALPPRRVARRIVSLADAPT